MPERKVWTEGQDKILRLLREERGERKWATIARVMEQEFGVGGRTGKQCRERYHNHLDSSIVSSGWTAAEEEILYEMHEEIGNKWSLISQKLPGRSDNCVKNHFYSKLRKSLRRLNKLIHDHFTPEYTLLKEGILSKIIKTTQSKFKTSSKVDEELADFCNDIKNRLFNFACQEETEQVEEDLQDVKKLLSDIQVFDKDYKKGYKGLKFDCDLQYLKPPPKTLKKNTSTRSFGSERSESSSSFFSSYGSESDLSEMDQKPQKSKTTEGFSNTFSSNRNSSNITVKSQGVKGQPMQGEVMRERESSWHQRDMSIEQFPVRPVSPISQGRPEHFSRNFRNLIEQDIDFYGDSNDVNIHFHNIYYDNTPVIARILGPSQLQSIQFLREERVQQQCEQQGSQGEIQYKMDHMGL